VPVDVEFFDMSAATDPTDLFAERFWKKLEESRKYDWFKEFRRMEGTEPMYVYLKENTVLVIYGRKSLTGYNIWIKAPNKDWSASVEIRYNSEKGEFDTTYFVAIDDKELNWKWDILIEAMEKVGGVVKSTITEIYRETRRQIAEGEQFQVAGQSR